MLCHLAALAMFVLPAFGNVLGPLIVWLLKREDSAVDAHGKEALNFQLSLWLYLVGATVSTLILTVFLVGIFLWPLLIAAFTFWHLFDAIMVIIASVKASNGQFFRYPITIRFIS
jgi:uncharacterized Tic20 family protein